MVEEFARHFRKPPDKLGLDELRTYRAYLPKKRKLAVGSVVNHVAALRFSRDSTWRRKKEERSRSGVIITVSDIPSVPPLAVSGDEWTNGKEKK